MSPSHVTFANVWVESLSTADLALLHTVSRRLNTLLELEQVLKCAAELGATLLRAPAAILALRNKGRRELIVRAWYGTPLACEEDPRGRGHRQACTACGDALSPHDAGPVGYGVDLTGARAAGYLMVPLLNEGRAIGILAIGPRPAESFTDLDEALLRTFGEDVVTAINRAERCSQLQAQLKELATLTEIDNEPRITARLRELNEVLRANRAAGRRAATMHSEVVQLLLDGRGLEAATHALANIVGNPVLVQDRLFRVIAHAFRQGRVDEHRKEIILTGETPRAIFEEAAIKERFQQLASDRRPARLPPCRKYGMQEATLIVPVIFEGEIQGYLSVVESNGRLEESDVSALEHAAAIFALELLRQKTAFEVEARLRGHFLDELVSGSYPSEELVVLRRAAALGHDLSRPHQILVVDIATGGSAGPAEEALPGTTKATLDRCCRLVYEVLARQAPGAVAVAKSGNIAVAAPTPRARTAGRPKSFAEEVAGAIKAQINHYLPDLPVSIGIGRECQRVSDYRESYEEARQAVALLTCFGRQNEIISFDSLGIYGLLLGSENQAKLSRFAEALLGQVIEYDLKHQGDLLHTLDVFLGEGGNLQHAADALFVHVNTARYRLQRVAEICGLDLHDVEARFNLQMALKILQVTGKYPRQRKGEAVTAP